MATADAFVCIEDGCANETINQSGAGGVFVDRYKTRWRCNSCVEKGQLEWRPRI